MKAKCFFPLAKLIKKIDLKNELKNLVTDVTDKSKEEKELIMKEKGMDLIFVLVDKLVDAEKETWDFMTLYLDKPVEDIQDMDMFDIAQTIMDLFKDERLKSLFI